MIRLLGRGGMGVVWLAEQRATKQEVAVKFCPQRGFGLDVDEASQLRFGREVELAARLRHPNIARIFGAGEAGGFAYYVMEYVNGPPLDAWFRSARSPRRVVIETMRAVCEAVQHAHQNAIIHRDLKPSNILMTAEGQPKVVDFGLAKTLEDEASSLQLSVSGQLLGTPRYMAPEQVRGQATDTRTDVYALGVILCELLTGQHPHETSGSRDALMHRIASEEPRRPRSLLPELDSELEMLLLKALSRNPDERYRTAGELADDLGRWLRQETLSAGKATGWYFARKWLRRHRAAALATLAAMLFVVGSTIWYVVGIRRSEAETARQRGIADERLRQTLAAEAKLREQLREASRSDRLVAEEKVRAGRDREALASLARACEYDPGSALPAEMVAGVLNAWDHPLPVAILGGHGEEIEDARFSSDGTRIFTTAKDLTARVWDAATWKTVATLRLPDGPFKSAEFCEDGTRILTVGDSTARVWDAKTGKVITILRADGDRTASARLSSDGTRVVTYGEMTTQLWDAATGQSLATLTGHEERLFNVSFSPDGTRIVTCSWDKTARVWDSATGAALATLTGHEQGVGNAHFSPDGKRIATASFDGTARVWEADSGRAICTLTGHSAIVFDATFSPDGQRIVTASEDGTARVWHAETGEVLATCSGHERGLFEASFSPDGTRIVTASEDATARVWDAATGTLVTVLFGHGDRVAEAQYSPDGTRILTTSRDGTARVWNVAPHPETALQITGYRAQFSPDGHRLVTGDVEYSPDGARFITKSESLRAEVWDAATGARVGTIEGEAKPTGKPRKGGKKGESALWQLSNPLPHVWDAQSGKELVTLTGHKKEIHSACFSRDGAHVVTGSWDGTARIWDTFTGQNLKTIQVDGEIHDASLSPDGGRLLTAGGEGNPQVWDAATGALLATMGGDQTSMLAQFSPDGRHVLSASDRLAFLWDAATGERVFTLQGHTGDLRSIRFSADGRRIVTAADDKTARLWDAATGKCLALLQGKEDMSDARFSPDRARVVTSSQGGARVWSLLPPTAGSPPAWFPGFLRYLAQLGLTAEGELKTLPPDEWLALREQLREVRRLTEKESSPYLEMLRRFVSE